MSDSEQDRARQEAHRKRLDDGLDRISELIHTTVDPDEILDRVVTEVTGATQADSAIIYLRENQKWVIRHLHGLPEELRGSHLEESELRASARPGIPPCCRDP